MNYVENTLERLYRTHSKITPTTSVVMNRERYYALLADRKAWRSGQVVANSGGYFTVLGVPMDEPDDKLDIDTIVLRDKGWELTI